MTKEELEHDHIKEIAENYINESWGSYLDLDEVDLVMAGIGVGKIIASEQEKRIAELEKSCDETQELLDKQIEATYKLVEENAELKKELEISQRCWQDQKNISLDTNCKLYKAKKIIKGLLSFIDSLGNYSGGIFDKAEQFIKE